MSISYFHLFFWLLLRRDVFLRRLSPPSVRLAWCTSRQATRGQRHLETTAQEETTCLCSKMVRKSQQAARTSTRQNCIFFRVSLKCTDIHRCAEVVLISVVDRRTSDINVWFISADSSCEGEPSKKQELWKTASLDRNPQLTHTDGVKRSVLK